MATLAPRTLRHGDRRVRSSTRDLHRQHTARIGRCRTHLLYALAAYGARWSSLTGLVLALLGSIAGTVRYFGYDGIPVSSQVMQSVAVMIFVLAVWAFGDLRRVRTKQLEGLTERARLLELERAQEAEIATISERSRIAREMHDIVAHSLTVVIAQADGGRYSAAKDPQAAIQALETIASTGRQALTDMRSLLSVLREDTPRDFSVIPAPATSTVSSTSYAAADSTSPSA